MNVFITGITGFAGVHLAETLLDLGHQVLGCSRRGIWPSHASASLRARVSPLQWDVTSPAAEELAATIARFQPTAMVHLAALSVPAECGVDEPHALARAVNVEGVRNVVRLAGRLSDKPRFLLASSCHVYRPVDAKCQQVDEQWPLGPANAYAKTKLAAEILLREACEQEGIDWLIARVFQHTGPGQSPRMMVPHWVRQFAASTDRPIEVFSLEAYLDISDVRDVTRGYVSLLESGRPATTYNVGGGRCWRSGDIFELIRARYDPGRCAVELAPRTQFHPIADLTRIVSHTGWQPRISLEGTLDDTYEFWKAELGK